MKTKAEQTEEISSAENLPHESAAQENGGDVATRAYFYWMERGCPDHGSDEDWFRAERESASQG